MAQGKGRGRGKGADSTSDHQSGKSLPIAISKNPQLRKFLITIQKAVLQSMLKHRDTESVLFDTLLGETDSPVVTAAKSQNMSYQKASEKKGHGLGPPMIWTCGGMLTALLEQTEKDATKGALHLETIQLKKIIGEFETLSMEGRAELCRFCRVTRCYRSEMTRITLACSPSPAGMALRAAILTGLVAGGWEMKVGRAPPVHLERELQGWLELFVQE